MVLVRTRALLAAATLATGATLVAVVATQPASAATVHRVLFDNTKAETAGNADWIISTSQPDPLGQNSNPTSDTSWTGALSSWGVALQRTGQYSLKTLNSGTITYGGSGALDLKNFDEFVLPEPNILLTAAEKKAVMQFVQNGGGLFLIVDHSGSDRNNDGADSVEVATDLMTSNGVDNTDPFGLTLDTNDISSENAVAVSSSSDPVINGSFGRVTGSIIRDGSTQTLHKADNANVKGLVFRPGSSPTGTTGAFFTTSTFGSGRVAVWGDSSPIDDGTGQSGNTLYDGWNDPAGTDAALALNGTAWLAGTGSSTPPPTGGGTTPPTGGTCGTAQLLGNTGFESGNTVWSASSGVISNSTSEPAHAGSYKAWLDGYGTAHTDTVSQTVTVPSGCSGATLSFWLLVDSDETTTTTAYDKLTVTAGGTTVGSYSNLNQGSSYVQRTLSITGSGSRAITFTGVEGNQLATAFVIDDVTLIPRA
jgi:hypothetical protein